MNKTTIEWVKNPDGSQGYTWNPITGCLNSCPYCYARRLANGRLKARYLANPDTAIKYQAEASIEEYEHQRTDPFYPRFWPQRLNDFGNPYYESTWKRKPKGVFTCDMGELFGSWVPAAWQASIIGVIAEFGQHRFYLLTKQPQNLDQWSPFPENCWVGVTATKQSEYDNAMMYLGEIEAKVKYLSIEPLLEPIKIEFKLHQWVVRDIVPRLDWLIIGACTGTYSELWHQAARLYSGDELNMVRTFRIRGEHAGRCTLLPKVEWVQDIVQAADKAGISVFLKDNLKPLLSEELPFYNVIDEDPMLTPRLRQEMPSEHSLENIKRR